MGHTGKIWSHCPHPSYLCQAISYRTLIFSTYLHCMYLSTFSAILHGHLRPFSLCCTIITLIWPNRYGRNCPHAIRMCSEIVAFVFKGLWCHDRYQHSVHHIHAWHQWTQTTPAMDQIHLNVPSTPRSWKRRSIGHHLLQITRMGARWQYTPHGLPGVED